MKERPRQERAGGRPGKARAVAQQRLGNADLGARVGQVLASTPLRTAPKALGPLLPRATAPDPLALGGVELPSPAPAATEEEVEGRARHLLSSALARERRFGEPVEPGDRVRVSCLAFAGGAPVPFTARYQLELSPGDERVPGARAGVVGEPVGTSVVMPLSLPEVSGQPHAGQRADLVIEIVAAFADAEASLDDELALRASQLAKDRAALLERARQDLEREAEAQRRAARRDAVLRKARERYPLDIPEAAIDGVVHLLWASAEGPVLERMKVPAEEQRALLDAWLSNPDVRQDARVRLWTMALVRAYGESRALTLTDVAVGKRLLEEVPGALELPASLLGGLFEESTREGPREGVWYLEAAERLTAEVLEAKGS